MKTVLCHGVFDILHAGHLAYFKKAKQWGEKLIVSVTTDKFVNKGPGRPYFGVEKRAEMLRALSCIDEVVISDHPTAVPVITSIKPDYYVKGPDYKDLTKDITGEIYNEKAAVEEHGGQLVFTQEETFSSSTIINKFFQPWTDAQKLEIDAVNSQGGIEAIEKAIDKLSQISCLVIGEPILDIYRFVNPEGISSKSPSLSARFQYEEEYHGGSWAIAKHLEGFVSSVHVQSNGRVAKKIRYISGTQRIFEVTHIDDSPCESEYICDKIKELAKHFSLVLLADFGHGLFEGPILEAIDDISTFTCLNVQANSSNYGFNVYKKHKRFDYLCLDTREARLAEHDRYSPATEIGGRIKERLNANVGLTLGPNGSCLFTNQGQHTSPAFADNIIDATGAGDAYFAITAALLKTGCNEKLIPFIGNVFAGLKTKIIGNKSPVSKPALLKACSGILK